jgi:hypothetical protein
MTSTIVPTPTQTFTLIPPPSLTPTPTPIRIGFPSWEIYTEGAESLINVRIITARTNNALELSYYIQSNGWVGIAQDIDPEILFQGYGISFFVTGGGTPETLELKLLYEPDLDGNSTIFSTSWSRESTTDGWVFLEAPFEMFTCWKGTPCPRDGKLDIEDVRRIDVAISNKSGDTAGPGFVIIDDIQVLK